MCTAYSQQRVETPAILAQTADNPIPFAVAQRRLISPGLAERHVLGRVQDRRIGFADDLFGAVAVHPACAFILEQDLAVEILAYDRILGRGFEHVGHEVHGFLSLANNAAVQKVVM